MLPSYKPVEAEDKNILQSGDWILKRYKNIFPLYKSNKAKAAIKIYFNQANSIA